MRGMFAPKVIFLSFICSTAASVVFMLLLLLAPQSWNRFYPYEKQRGHIHASILRGKSNLWFPCWLLNSVLLCWPLSHLIILSPELEGGRVHHFPHNGLRCEREHPWWTHGAGLPNRCHHSSQIHQLWQWRTLCKRFTSLPPLRPNGLPLSYQSFVLTLSFLFCDVPGCCCCLDHTGYVGGTGRPDVRPNKGNKPNCNRSTTLAHNLRKCFLHQHWLTTLSCCCCCCWHQQMVSQAGEKLGLTGSFISKSYIEIYLDKYGNRNSLTASPKDAATLTNASANENATLHNFISAKLWTAPFSPIKPCCFACCLLCSRLDTHTRGTGPGQLSLDWSIKKRTQRIECKNKDARGTVRKCVGECFVWFSSLQTQTSSQHHSKLLNFLMGHLQSRCHRRHPHPSPAVCSRRRCHRWTRPMPPVPQTNTGALMLLYTYTHHATSESDVWIYVCVSVW